MNSNQNEIRDLLKSIEDEYSGDLIPASIENIELFKIKAVANGVNTSVIEQLVDLYTVADNYMAQMILGFHSCNDAVLYEWWAEKELWLGQLDFNTIRWANDKFCLGDASNTSYSKNNEYDTLIDLIKGCIEEINELNE
ncbi:hypothetical protein QSV08_07865 [Maribacter sp. BPC-D8]|uniref:hypothetical protein n=1 Tax=Maribacter sp. BPC-D8 TaxID=3053613 RepID=UPI002B45E4A1|nr:hypothetical protein [Maribacter sp. BPC-D8]WRI31161.1 hypothetical protein QSV08_07865 [Maribacter sp. BPC-D8]